MKRVWIIPAVICLLLLAAWPLRWEKGPVQSDSKAKIIHMRDRWTGQSWVALYGVVDGQLLSGEMRPVPPQADIAKRKEQILASPEEVQKRQELEKKLAEYEEKVKHLPPKWDDKGNWRPFTKEELELIDVTEEKANLQKQAETAARSDLSYFAWQKRNIATGIWTGLVALSAVMAGILFIRNSRSQKASGL